MSMYLDFSPAPTCNVYEADAMLPVGSKEARLMYGEPYEGQVILPIHSFGRILNLLFVFSVLVHTTKTFIYNESSSHYIY